MILDQVFLALGSSWAYPYQQLLLLNLVLFLCTHNLQKVPLLSWSPEVFCAQRNSSGIYPYNFTSGGPVFYSISEKCTKKKDGSLLDCTISDWMEKDPKKCSPLAVREFPKCDQTNSALVYRAPRDHSTVITFDNVCSRAEYVRLEDAFYFVGSAVAFFTCVPLGDLIGRKPIILNMCICFGILNTIMALSPTAELLITCRFLSGMCYALVTGLTSVLMYELNPPHRRIAVAVVGQFSASYAQMLLGLTSYAIPNWRWWVGFEALLAVVMACLMTKVPESARWLLIVHRSDPEMNEDCEIRARAIVMSILKKRIRTKRAPKNIAELTAIRETLKHAGSLEVGSFVTVDFDEKLKPRGSESPLHARNLNAKDGNLITPDARDKKKLELHRNSLRQVSFRSKTKQKMKMRGKGLFHADGSSSYDEGFSATLSGESEQNIHNVKKQMTPVLWRCLFILMLMRTVVNVVYYALGLSSNVLFTGTRHWNIFYMGLIEVPVGPLCYFLNMKVPRRVGLSLMFLLTGVPFLIMGIWNFLQSELPEAARYVFFLMGKSSATASVMMVNLYMAEVFPTTVRTTFSGICSGVARSCSIFSTLAPSVFKKYNAELVTVLSALSLLCSGLIWLLPETKDRKLPQTPSDLQTIHLETKSLAETLRSTRISSTNSRMVKGFMQDGVIGAGGLGESGIVGESGVDNPAVSFSMPEAEPVDSKKPPKPLDSIME